MTSFRNIFSSISLCVFLTLVVTKVQVKGDLDIPKNLILKSPLTKITKKCDINECPGPLIYYRTLNCKPEFENGDCCPYRFDCDHVYDHTPRRCWLNDELYSMWDKVTPSEANHCEEDCTCRGKQGHAYFQCPSVEKICAGSAPSNDSCYMRNSLNQCCPEEVCPKLSHTFKCQDADGTKYSNGDYALLKNYPDYLCICIGDDTAGPYFKCKLSNRPVGSNINTVYEILKRCVPVYRPYTNNTVRVQVTTRCPQDGDFIVCSRGDVEPWVYERIHKPYRGVTETEMNDACGGPAYPGVEHAKVVSAQCRDMVTEADSQSRLCIYSRWSMHIGDIINFIPYGNDSCIACTCEVPQIPTCVIRERSYCIFNETTVLENF